MISKDTYDAIQAARVAVSKPRKRRGDKASCSSILPRAAPAARV